MHTKRFAGRCAKQRRSPAPRNARSRLLAESSPSLEQADHGPPVNGLAVHVSSRLGALVLTAQDIKRLAALDWKNRTVSKPHSALERGNSILALPLDMPLPGLAGLACVHGGPMGGDMLGRA